MMEDHISIAVSEEAISRRSHRSRRRAETELVSLSWRRDFPDGLREASTQRRKSNQREQDGRNLPRLQGVR
uniref:Uncharacterized protein n=1 Tax=Anopheles atroparvus TaxID=41427 RepID=A0AAG5DPU7_ANOAO